MQRCTRVAEREDKKKTSNPKRISFNTALALKAADGKEHIPHTALPRQTEVKIWWDSDCPKPDILSITAAKIKPSSIQVVPKQPAQA